MGTTSKSVFAQLSSPLQQYQTLRATSLPKMEVSRDNVKVSFFGASRTCCSPLICHTHITSATGQEPHGGKCNLAGFFIFDCS